MAIVNLKEYAEKNIKENFFIKEIPKENLEYLNSGLIPSNMYSMFFGCASLEKVPKLNIDTYCCNDMSLLHFGCLSLKDIEWLKYLNTENVEYLMLAFGNCENLRTINLSNWNTKNVKILSFAFFACYNLIYINVSNWNTKSLKQIDFLCANCFSLRVIDISNWDTSNVICMRNAFEDCKNLLHIEGAIDMKNCKDFENMFKGCYKLSGVKIKNPPKDFESISGLARYQYEVVE